MRLLFCLCLLACGSRAVESSPQTGPLVRFVIGVSPYLDNSVKDETYRSIVRLLVEDLPLNSSLAIYDAFNLKTITQVALPNIAAFNSSKTRANQFAPAVRELKLFLATDHPRPVSKQLHFQEAIRLPQFCDFLSDNFHGPDSPVFVLLLGSPLYQDAKEPAFSMVDGFFPSDGHLQARRDKSIFGCQTGSNSNPRIVVHWVYFGDPWISDLHQEKITRFWTLYMERRGGQLAAFSGDLSTVVHAFRHAPDIKAATSPRWALDPNQAKVEMLRITRDLPQTDWLMNGELSEATPLAPHELVGPMKIGIRWTGAIDLDLYASPGRGGETLFFQHPRSPEGYYYKDHRTSPGREYEFIEFESPVDVREVEAFVNFYQGSCAGGPRGEVRIELAGRIYGAPFSIRSAEGNRGQTGQGQGDFWTRIPLKNILRLEGGINPGG
jgi:hypothetical protein